MRFARRLRQEVDLWGVAWQQVETFVDRVAGAADQDASPRRKVEALLVVAGVVERARRLTDTRALGAPVLWSMPTTRADADGASEAISDPWSPDDRSTRLPGLDDLELAAGPVTAVDESGEPIEDDLTLVRLMAPRSVPARVDARAGTVELGVMPSYDPAATGPGSSIVGAMDRVADIEGDDGDLAGLFSVARRVVATMGTEPDVEQVRTWRELAADRRDGVAADTKIALGAPSVAARAATLASGATELVEALRAGTTTPAAAGSALQALLATPAAQGSGGDAGDVAALLDAAQTLEDEGTDDPSLPAAVRAVATAFASTPGARQAVVDAITSLAASPGSAARQDALLAAAAVLGLTMSTAGLLGTRVEDGPLGAELDKVVAARLSYPDGSLRMVRALESAFAWSWPQRRQWFVTRRDLVLAPLVARFRDPFHASLRALVSGGDTGLLALGLTLGPSVTVGSTQVVTGEPATLADSVDDIEPGQVGVVGGDRPVVLTVLGVGVAHQRLALDVAPVRIALTGDGGTAGLVAGGLSIDTLSGGLSGAELRAGESDDGAAADGVVAETLALWSQSCAVFGRASVEGASVPVPDPPGPSLESVPLFGAVPARATTLVLTDLPDAMWDRSDPTDPTPRLVRTGEVLLLRGTSTPDDGGPATVVQGVVEVDTVARTTGSVLAAMDLTGAGRLSTAPLDADETGVPSFRCGPDEDVAIVTLRRSTVDVPVSETITLRRDFAGFDVMSLAARRLLPPELFGGPSAGPAGVDRSREFSFASETFTGWLRYAHHG